MPVYILAGEQELEIARRVEKLKSEIVDPAWLAFNFAKLINPTMSEVTDAAATLPFGPGKRMVLIDRCELFTKKKSKDVANAVAEKAVKQDLEQLENALVNVSPDTFLVFACPYNFDSTLRTSKMVVKYVQIESFSKERYFPGGHNPGLENWCKREADRHGATISDDAIRYLLESTEANLRQIASEIEKAATFLLPKKNITLEVITELSSHHSHVFAFLDNWANGRRSSVLNNLDELLSKQSGIPIIATLHTTLNKWIQINALAENIQSASEVQLSKRELSLNELADKLAVQLNMKPFVLKMELSRIKNLSVDLLINKRIELARLDGLIKTGQMTDQHALALFVIS